MFWLIVSVLSCFWVFIRNHVLSYKFRYVNSQKIQFIYEFNDSFEFIKMNSYAIVHHWFNTINSEYWIILDFQLWIHIMNSCLWNQIHEFTGRESDFILWILISEFMYSWIIWSFRTWFHIAYEFIWTFHRWIHIWMHMIFSCMKLLWIHMFHEFICSWIHTCLWISRVYQSFRCLWRLLGISHSSRPGRPWAGRLTDVSIESR